MLGDVERRDAVLSELRDVPCDTVSLGVVTASAWTALPEASVRAKRERLQGELVHLRFAALDEDEDAHATPIRCSTSTTRGAASGP